MTTSTPAAEVREASSSAAWRHRIAEISSALALGIALIAFVAYPVLAARWLTRPFLGAFVEQTLVFNDTGPTQKDAWATRLGGVSFGDRLLALDGEAIETTQDLERWLARAEVGQAFQVSLTTRTGEPRSLESVLQSFPQTDFFAYFLLPYSIGLAYLAAGIWVYRLRRQQSSAQVFAVFAAATAIVLGGLFDLYTTHRFTRLWSLALPLAAGSLASLAIIFPQPIPQLSRMPTLRWAGFYVGLMIGLASQIQLFNSDQPTAYVLWWRAEYLLAALSFIFFLAWMSYRRYTARSPIVREQSRIILFGGIVGLTPIAVWFLVTTIWPAITFNAVWLLPPLVLFPLSIAYAILRYRLLNVDAILSRTLVYAALAVLATAGYALMAIGVALILGRGLPANDPLLLGMMVFAVALALSPVRDWLTRRIDYLFFRGSRAYQERLQTFGRQLTKALELRAITEGLQEHIEASLNPVHLHIFVYDSISQQYAATRANGSPTTELRFGTASGLVQHLQETTASLHLASGDPLPGRLIGDRSKLAVLGSVVYVPLSTQDQLTGWLALGPRRSGDPYTRDDLSFLESLADQSTLAIARAQVVVDLEHRVNELNVLSRVAQAINFTPSYDDLLELIYAQTNHVIPTRDFSIALFDETRSSLQFAFLLRDNERLFEEEGKPLDQDAGLLPWIAENGSPLRIDDYQAECAARGVQPEADFRTWMGVPLHAGASTLGALGIGSRERGLGYSEEQMKILWAIADQAAGAIVKARLYRETEVRARQLGTLNQIAGTLAATLDINPLMQRILTSALELLDCEAGSLVLVDEGTGDLTFKVTAGPEASTLAGRRLPPGTGLLGEAIDRGAPLLVQDAREVELGQERQALLGDFEPKSLMIIPLQVKDRIIGALEVWNKRSGVAFNADDQALLAAFAAQAAVAVENARLYTLTDQALAARVEELSVMQRIDRELSVSLDIERAIAITLTWALRHSDADAGLIAMLDDEGQFRVMASQGYPAGFEPDTEKPPPANLGALEEVVLTGELLIQGDIASDERVRGLHPASRAFVTLPLQRGNQPVGAMLLESVKPNYFNEDRLAFLARLSDHASIAIANAQLYDEVQKANLAKSEFVSFVSHELRTPMTSIKGYADLLAQGNVGPISETQSSFLNTIRSNVNRMSSLVSDLTDISRIESGRLALEYEAVDFEGIVDEVVRSVQERVDSKKQHLVIEMEAPLPPAWGDRTRLTQILTNLLSNAHKYTPEEGTIKIAVSRKGGEAELAGIPEVLHISVSDTGIGIAKEEKEGIFQKFFRSEDRAVRESPGTGLGLSICKNLVELQGGQIWFESTHGAGSTFHFTVPVAEEAVASTTLPQPEGTALGGEASPEDRPEAP